MSSPSRARSRAPRARGARGRRGGGGAQGGASSPGAAVSSSAARTIQANVARRWGPSSPSARSRRTVGPCGARARGSSFSPSASTGARSRAGRSSSAGRVERPQLFRLPGRARVRRQLHAPATRADPNFRRAARHPLRGRGRHRHGALRPPEAKKAELAEDKLLDSIIVAVKQGSSWPPPPHRDHRRQPVAQTLRRDGGEIPGVQRRADALRAELEAPSDLATRRPADSPVQTPSWPVPPTAPRGAVIGGAKTPPAVTLDAAPVRILVSRRTVFLAHDVAVRTARPFRSAPRTELSVAAGTSPSPASLHLLFAHGIVDNPPAVGGGAGRRESQTDRRRRWAGDSDSSPLRLPRPLHLRPRAPNWRICRPDASAP